MQARILDSVGKLSAVVYLCAIFLSLDARANPKIGGVPPPLQLSAIIQGPAPNAITWESLQGKVVVLEFWNTRCGPCIQAIPHLNELVSRFANQPVVFLSISDDNPDRLKTFLKQKPISGWLAIDAPLAPTAETFGVIGIPHTVLIDRAQKIAAITHPSILKPEHIQELLDSKPSSLPPRETYTAPTTAAESPDIALPEKINVSITGPFPKPDGAYASRGWKFNCIFTADKAPVANIIEAFFDVSEKLLPPLDFGEELYDVRAEAPPEQRAELQNQFIKAARDKWRLAVQPTRREYDVYVMTVSSTNAPALKRVDTRKGGGQTPGGFKLGGSAIRTIASYLELSLDKPVIDETHLDGLWAAELKWQMTDEELSGNAKTDPTKVLKAARDQLGLYLQPARRELPALDIQKLPK